MLSRIYLRAGIDAILQCAPTFGMYQVAAHMQGAGVIEVPLERGAAWSLDPRTAARCLAAHTSSSCISARRTIRPANLLAPGALETICERPRRQSHRRDRRGLCRVVAPREPDRLAAALLDAGRSCARSRRPTRWRARASARCSAHAEMIQLARRVIPPYSLAQPTIEAALHALEPQELAPRAPRSRRCSGSANTCASACSLRPWSSACGRAMRISC